ncbi:MAG: hypothetical protein ABFR36_07745 [Acidobacteriota bacterium]
MVVINVEVPVRVMFKGKPVDNLKKSDFKLFENGKELSINGFHIVRKKISSQKIELDSERKQFYEPRLFVLAFSVTNFNDFYEKGVRYFFDTVLRGQDKLLVFVNNTTLTYNDLKNKGHILNDILFALETEGKKARINMRSVLMTVEGGVAVLLSQLASSPRGRGAAGIGNSQAQRDVLTFFIRYKNAWENYKRSFLQLNIYTLYNFAAFLKRITLEKWVISFYQYEKFPILNENSRGAGRIIGSMGLDSQNILRHVRQEFNANRFFPYEEVSKIYYNLGATFNLVVIPTRIETDMNEIEPGDISTSAEVTLREIAKRTGGSVSFTTNLSNSLEKIIEKEDISYILTYAPEDSSRRGKLKIKLPGKKHKLLYDNNQRAGFIKRKMKKYTAKEKMVKVENLQFVDKKLVFKLINFELKKEKKNKSGQLGVNLIIKDQSGMIIFDEKKTINPKNGSTEMSIGFGWLKPGKYDLIIDVRDMLTNHKAFEYLKIEVK